MKAAVFYGKKDMRIEDRPTPIVGDDDVLIKVKACGICGTDVHIYEGHEGCAIVTPPTILGHEFSGVVAGVGKNVTHVQPGDNVSIDPNRLCGKCRFCLDGQGHFCQSMVGYGTTADGGFAEYAVVSAQQAHPFHNISFEEAAMAEPVSCCLHGLDLADVKPGMTVLIIGAGPIGLLMLQLVKLAGAAKIYVSEISPEKRNIAKDLGADIVIDPMATPLTDALAGVHIDRVVECAGLKATMSDAIKVAGPMATIMLFGLGTPDDEIPVKPFEIFKKELKITASFINPYTMGRALSLLDAGRIQIKPLIAKSVGIDELPAMFAEGTTQKNGKTFVVFE